MSNRDIVSIHARRATGDRPMPKTVSLFSRFQFTPVVRRATASSWRRTRRCWFQFTPVVRRATSRAASRHVLL